MANRKKGKVFIIYVAVILFVFALCVPILQQKIKSRNYVADVGELRTDAENDLPSVGLAAEAGDGAIVFPADPLPVLEPNLSKMVWPLKGAVLREVGLSYAQTFGDYRYHNGLDIQAARGAEVVAALPGIVVSQERTKEEGLKLILEHGQGWFSEYVHLEDAVKQLGDYCRVGELLGTVNQPGLWEVLEGPHLHFTLRLEEKVVNPRDYLPPLL